MSWLRRPGLGLIVMLLGGAGCTAILGDGRYYVDSDSDSDGGVADAGLDGSHGAADAAPRQ